MSFRDVVKQLSGATPPIAPINDIEAKRAAEIEEYHRQYANPAYRMGSARQRDVNKALVRLRVNQGGSLLDIGTGRGELLTMARNVGFFPVLGTEVVDGLLCGDTIRAEAHALPFGDEEWDHVFCVDVLEHLLPEDVPAAICEINRVAHKTITISAATRPSMFGGRDLHISARSIEAWNALFSELIPAARGEAAPCGSFGSTPVWRFVKF